MRVHRQRWLRRAGASASRRGSSSLSPVWLLLFFLIPFVIVLKICFAETQHRACRLTRRSSSGWRSSYVQLRLNLANYLFLLERLAVREGLSQLAQGRRHLHAALPAASAIPWPMASRARRPAWRNVLLMLIILPFWTSFLLRVYAWIGS